MYAIGFAGTTGIYRYNLKNQKQFERKRKRNNKTEHRLYS